MDKLGAYNIATKCLWNNNPPSPLFCAWHLTSTLNTTTCTTSWEATLCGSQQARVTPKNISHVCRFSQIRRFPWRHPRHGVGHQWPRVHDRWTQCGQKKQAMGFFDGHHCHGGCFNIGATKMITLWACNEFELSHMDTRDKVRGATNISFHLNPVKHRFR